MAKIEDKVLEKLYGKLVCEQEISFQDTKFFGDSEKRVIKFKIYDGFAYCEDFEGEELFLTYPKLEFINSCREMAQAVREFLSIPDTEKIGVVDIVQSYCTLCKV